MLIWIFASPYASSHSSLFSYLYLFHAAKDQFWHIDTVATMGNDLKFARSFVPSYSLFIPLQDTTAEMGATETCPGTQVCHEGGADEFCAEYGFQVSGGDGGVWKRGYGVLQNQHTYHRGPAHKDPHGQHRVLFILTFAPRPNDRAESRMIGQGGSYSIRWDMWGHTLSDLADATWRMAQPWATLKALGVYKLPGAKWGWDYPAVVSMRMINEDTGFAEEDLDNFIENGGFDWLPKFINEEASDEGWVEYLVDCLDLSKKFLVKANKLAILSYLGAAIVLSILQLVFASRSKSGTNRPRVFVLGAVKRLIVTHSIIAIAGHLVLRHIASTPWAKDVKFGRHFASSLADAADFHEKDYSHWQPTLPQKIDALFAIRYDGENYGSINRFLDYHPGNQWFNSLVQHFAGPEQSFSKAPFVLQEQSIKTILGEMKRDGRRILLQIESGGWREASSAESQELTERELLKADNKVLHMLDAKIALMLAKARYGELRSTAMAQKFTVDLLVSMRRQVFAQKRVTWSASLPDSPKQQLRRMSQFRIDPNAVLGAITIQMTSLHVGDVVTSTLLHRANTMSCICNAQHCRNDDQETQFLPSVGDVVEAKYEGKHNEWYKARVTKINPLKYGYDLEYFDGDTDRGLGLFAIRRYISPQVREVIEARVPGSKDEWALCAVTKVHKGEEYDVKFEDGMRAYSLPVAEIRRVDWEFEEGDEVIVLTSAAESKWLRGVVSSDRKDGTYDIGYEDGNEGLGVAQESIHLIWALD